MAEPIKTEKILKDILKVLEKHSIAVSTIKIDVSMLEDQFELTFPHLKEYKAGHYYKTLDVLNIPGTIHVKRRFPFDEIMIGLKKNILPSMNTLAKELALEHKEISVEINEPRYESETGWPARFGYNIEIKCRKGDHPQIDHEGTVILSVGIKQIDTTTYPLIHAFVGRLSDEESGGDFGIDMVSKYFHYEEDFQHHTFNELQKYLPLIFDDMKKEVNKFSQEKS